MAGSLICPTSVTLNIKRHVLFAKTLPAKIDLRKNCPAVYDQGQLGSCTANAIAGAIEFEVLQQNAANDFMPHGYLFITTKE